MRYVVLSLLLLSACAAANQTAHDDAASSSPAPVVAAERAFAARAGEVGWIPAFREYTAPDGQLIGQAGLVSAPERMNALPDDGQRTLYWAPAYAGIARSGDLGFTTGPVSFDEARTPQIQYFTMWRRQADGSWRWIFDGGPGPIAEPGPFLPLGEEPRALPIAGAGVGSAAAAIQQVAALEGGAMTAAAIGALLASDAHVYRQGQARTYGGPSSRAAMAYPTEAVSYRLVRTEASSAGDLAFTLGEASWEHEGVARQGYFARVWQYRPEGWRIVYDQLVPRPAPRPAAN